MKAIFLYLLLCILSFLFFVLRDNRPEDKRLIHSIMMNVSNTLREEYQIYNVATDRSSTRKTQQIGLCFISYGIKSKDECRRLIINALNEFLHQLNSNSKIKRFYKEPFTYKDLYVLILISDVNGKKALHPDIRTVVTDEGTIRYNTIFKEDDLKYYTNEQEPLEEALRILDAQDKERTVVSSEQVL